MPGLGPEGAQALLPGQMLTQWDWTLCWQVKTSTFGFDVIVVVILDLLTRATISVDECNSDRYVMQLDE